MSTWMCHRDRSLRCRADRDRQVDAHRRLPRPTARTRGAITVDGIDVRDLDPESWADQLAVVGQRPTALGRSVTDEVRGSTEASDDLVAAALDDVGLTGLGPRANRRTLGLAVATCASGPALVAVEPVARASCSPTNRPLTSMPRTLDVCGTRSAGLRTRSTVPPCWSATHDDRCRRSRITSSNSGSIVPPSQQAARPRSDRPHDTLRPHLVSRPVVFADTDAERPSPTRRELAPPTRRVMQMARPARRRFAGATLLGALAEVCTLGLAAVAAWLIVKASENNRISPSCRSRFSLFARSASARACSGTENDWRRTMPDCDRSARSVLRVVDRLADIAPAGIPGWARGDVLQRVVNDVDRLLDLFVRVLGPVLAVAVTAGRGCPDHGRARSRSRARPARGTGDHRCGAARGHRCPRGIDRPADGRAARSARRQCAVVHRVARRNDRPPRRASGAAQHRGRTASELDVLSSRRTRLRCATAAVVAAAPLVTTIATLAVIGPSASSISGPVLAVLVLWPLAIMELVGSVNEAAATLPSVAGSAHRVWSRCSTLPIRCRSRPIPTPCATSPDIALDDLTADGRRVGTTHSVLCRSSFRTVRTPRSPARAGVASRRSLLRWSGSCHHITAGIDSTATTSAPSEGPWRASG